MLTHRSIGLAVILAVVIGAALSAAGAQSSSAPAVSITYVPLGGARVMQAAPAAADFNGDGRKEIVVAAMDGKVYVISNNGSSWSKVWERQVATDLNAAGAPRGLPTTDIRGAPAIADLDGDGKLEIVLTVGGDISQHYDGGAIVYHYNSAWSFSVAPGWPQPKIDAVGAGAGASSPDGAWDGIWGAPALGDLDGDGDLEIVVEGFDRRIHAWHHTGVPVDGWPIFRSNGDPLLRGGWSSPALGDIDGDGQLEVVVGTDSPPWGGETSPPPDYTKSTVWAINGDSSLVPGFPVVTDQQIQSSPALGDIDGDGQLEIVVGTGQGIAGTGGYRVHAWNGNGSIVPGWPKVTSGNMQSSPAIADLNGSGGLDVIIGCGLESDASCKYLYALSGSASNLPGFPMQPLDANPWPGGHQPQGQPYPPIVADVDGDNQLEVLLVMSASTGVSVVERNGAMNSDYSRNTFGYGNDVFVAPPLVDDVDGDGLLETVAAGKGTSGQAAVYIYEETASASANRPWPMVKHDVRRTGNYCFSETLPTPPTTFNATPPINAWTNDNTISASWSGATAQGCGVQGYSVVWSASPSTLPDTTLETTSANVTSAPLADNANWYLHVRTRDRGVNWSANAAHYGPFKIDSVAPTSIASSAAYTSSTSFPVSWVGSDATSGIDAYDVQVRVNGGSWSNWQTNVTSTSAVYPGSAGNTYSFRSRARDVAGNVESYPASADTTTRVTAFAFTGRVFNNAGSPVFNAQVQPSPSMLAALASDSDGNYGLFFDMAGTYSLSVIRAGFGVLPPMKNVSGGDQTGLDFYLPPSTDAISNGQLESGSLSGWTTAGTAAITATAHTGDGAVELSGMGVSSIEQSVSLPGDGPLTLSLLYRLGNSPNASTTATVSAIGSQTLSTPLDLSPSDWSHAALDVSALAGQTVTVRIEFDAAVNNDSIILDELSLGVTTPGIYFIYLPDTFRN